MWEVVFQGLTVGKKTTASSESLSRFGAECFGAECRASFYMRRPIALQSETKEAGDTRLELVTSTV